MTVKVSAPEKVDSQSRKVRRYVTARLKRDALRHAVLIAESDVKVVEATLTGGQLGEAHRLLGAGYLVPMEMTR